MPDPVGAIRSGPVLVEDGALLTDLYELTMAASYLREGMNEPATFSLFVRKLPPGRGFLVAAGLADVLRRLRDFRFGPRAVNHLRRSARFEPEVLRRLAATRFTGRVRAVPEGTAIFPDEPLLEITAPLVEAQLVETAVLNACHYPTVVASKAARSVLAARGRDVVEFGLRRAPGVDAGLTAARSAYLAGAAGSSNVLAELVYGIPATGTMAHSYVQAFSSEAAAFETFARAFPDRCILLLDTYDTVTAAAKAVAVGRALARRGHRLAGVRLDSGDLVALSHAVRRALDEAGLPDVRILASGGVDEVTIARVLAAGAPIDAFGVGTRMDVSADAPSLDMAYKLVRYGRRNTLKLSPGKVTWTGPKQVYRRVGAYGAFEGDVLALADEPAPPGTVPLLETVMEGGRPIRPDPPLEALRTRCLAELRRLPAELREIHPRSAYPVQVSDALQAAQSEARVAAIARETPPRPAPARPTRPTGGEKEKVGACGTLVVS